MLALAILVTIAAGYYTATHFAINTNTNEFISARLPWRQNLIALDKAFPQRVDQIVVVIDGATPELAEAAAQSLTESCLLYTSALNAVQRDPRSAEVQKAVAWLKTIQNKDGGWGEGGESYALDYAGYCPAPSTPSQTAWALLGLMAAGVVEDNAVTLGVRYLARTQAEDGFRCV